MAPSDKVVSDAIRNDVRRMFIGPDRDNLTVNKIRQNVEAELHLEKEFFKQGSWKQQSKNIVKTESEKLLQLEEAGEELPSFQSTPATVRAAPPKKPTQDPVKKGVKRPSNGDKAQGRKHQKKEATPLSEDEDEDEGSALTSIGDTPEEREDTYLSDTPEPKNSQKSAVKPVAKGPAKKKLKDGKGKKEQDAGIGQKSHVPDPKPIKKASNEENVQQDDSDQSVKNSFGDGSVKGDPLRIQGEADLQSDSEMSLVLDETPKRKTKSKSMSKGQSSTLTGRSSKAPKLSKHPPDLSPEEAEIKTLQSQLVMCGVRKIWGVILKDYGSDTRAKIRHLKGMLRDIGMDGKFSKQKAEEIKEARELQADLEAVKEGDAKWGMGKGARSKKASGGKKSAGYNDEEEDDVAARNTSVTEKQSSRFARAKMDLAFLGDESESDD